MTYICPDVRTKITHEIRLRPASFYAGTKREMENQPDLVYL